MLFDPAAKRRNQLRTAMSRSALESDAQRDVTTRRHPFLGMAGHQDTVILTEETSGQFLALHTHKVNRSLWILLSVFCGWPFFILLNDRFQWIPMGSVTSDFNWYCLLAVGLTGLLLFGYLLSTPRWIVCDLIEQTLIYRIGGLRSFAFRVDLLTIVDISILKHFVVRRGGTRHDFPASAEPPSSTLGIKYTVKLSLKGGGATYPFVTGTEVVAREFVHRLTSRLVELPATATFA